MYTNVKAYTDEKLLNRVSQTNNFTQFPKGYWLVGVQSQEDEYNIFDDKIYLFHHTNFISVAEGTTNAGTTGLMNYNRYNSKGVAVIKTNEWYQDLWKFGYHRGRMPALRQHTPILYYRDWNKNRKAEEIGKVHRGIIGINFHTVLYQKNLSFLRRLIGGWSTGCQVVNHVGKYYKMLDLLKPQSIVSYCLIKEF